MRRRTDFAELISRLRSDRRGAILAVLGAFIGITFLVAAVAVDGAYLYSMRNRLQAVADLAAIAAVREIGDQAMMEVAVASVVETNMPSSENGEVVSTSDVTLGHWDRSTRVFTVDETAPTAVRVVANRTHTNGNPAETFFASAIGLGEIDIAARSIAAVKPEAPLCLLALDPTANRALDVGGSGTITATDCAVYSNSTAADSISLSSGGGLDALHICSAGGAAGTGYSPAPELNCPPVNDPLAYLPEPDTSTMPQNQFVVQNGRIELQPGVHPGSGHYGSGHLYLFPGTHVFTGKLTIGAGMTVTGNDVVMIFTGSAYMEMQGAATIDLTAPTTGEYAGVAFYASRNQSGLTYTLNGTTAMSIDGTIYLPTSHVQFTGNSTASITMLVADTITFTGNSGFQRDTNSTNVPLPAGFDALSGVPGSVALVH